MNRIPYLIAAVTFATSIYNWKLAGSDIVNLFSLAVVLLLLVIYVAQRLKAEGARRTKLFKEGQRFIDSANNMGHEDKAE